MDLPKIGTDPTGAGERGEAPELQVAALGGEKTGARNSGARGVPVAEPARAGRQFELPRLAEVRKTFWQAARVGGGPVTPVVPPQCTMPLHVSQG